MAEYIEREKAWRKVNRAKNIEEALKLIDSLPTADVVEVVRCKECKYCEWVDDVIIDVRHYFCEMYNHTNVDADGYCYKGERKL